MPNCSLGFLQICFFCASEQIMFLENFAGVESSPIYTPLRVGSICCNQNRGALSTVQNLLSDMWYGNGIAV
jgi:hypothetical protein